MNPNNRKYGLLLKIRGCYVCRVLSVEHSLPVWGDTLMLTFDTLTFDALMVDLCQFA